MKNVHSNHRKRLRERFEREGAFSLEHHELLELFLFDAIPRKNTNETAHLLLSRFGSLEAVLSAPYDELIKVRGIGKHTAAYIVDSYKAFCEDIERRFRMRRIDTLEHASNLLIWHRSHAAIDGGVTLVMLADDYSLIDIADVEGFNADEVNSLLHENQAKRLIICTGGAAEAFDDAVKSLDFEVTDVISVNGYTAKSLLIPDEAAIHPIRLHY